MRNKFLYSIGILVLLLMSGIALPLAHAQTCAGDSYTVRTGDTLYSIAAAYGIDASSIVATNGIVNINDIEIAQTLCIPTNNAFGTGGPTAQTPSTNTVTTTTTTTTGACNGTTYVVGAGENLYRIGLQYNLTAQQVAQANGIVDVNSVFSGQVLCIPSGATATTFGTGGATAQATTGTSTTLPATVEINDGTYTLNRAVDATVLSFPAGFFDDVSGFNTMVSVTLDVTNDILRLQGGGHIPNSQVGIFISSVPGDLSGGIIGALMADSNGRFDGYVEIPFLSGETRQYVMVRSYDGRQTFGYMDVPARFPN